jgi:hypothetical protein
VIKIKKRKGKWDWDGAVVVVVAVAGCRSRRRSVLVACWVHGAWCALCTVLVLVLANGVFKVQ